MRTKKTQIVSGQRQSICDQNDISSSLDPSGIESVDSEPNPLYFKTNIWFLPEGDSQDHVALEEGQTHEEPATETLLDGWWKHFGQTPGIFLDHMFLSVASGNRLGIHDGFLNDCSCRSASDLHLDCVFSRELKKTLV